MCVTIFRFRLHIFQVQDYYNVQVDGWDRADVWTRPALDTTVDTVDTRHQSQTTLDARASSLQLENIEFSFTFLTSR